MVLLTIAIVGLMWRVRKELKRKGALVCGHPMNLSMRDLDMTLSSLTPYCMMPSGLKDPPSQTDGYHDPWIAHYTNNVAKGQDPRPGVGGRLGLWYSQAIYNVWATQGLLNLSSHLGSRIPEFLALSLSRASLAPPKANNLSHSSQKLAVLSLPSGYGCLLGEPSL